MDRSSLQDELDIHQLLAEYCHLCDDGDFEALVDRFTDDASFVFGDRTYTGRADLLRWFERAQSPDRRGKHLTSNVVTRLDGDRASVDSDFVFLVKSGAAVVPLLAGRYLDDLEHGGDRWRIRRRVASTL